MKGDGKPRTCRRTNGVAACPNMTRQIPENEIFFVIFVNLRGGGTQKVFDVLMVTKQIDVLPTTQTAHPVLLNVLGI